MAINTKTAGPVFTDAVVRQFALAAVLWGIVGMLVGVVIAAQLAPVLDLVGVEAPHAGEAQLVAGRERGLTQGLGVAELGHHAV